MELIRRGLRPNIELFYYVSQAGYETDFILRSGHETKQLIQVCYDIKELSAKEREIRALIAAADELNCKDCSIITWEREETLELESITVRLIPLYKWIMEYQKS